MIRENFNVTLVQIEDGIVKLPSRNSGKIVFVNNREKFK